MGKTMWVSRNEVGSAEAEVASSWRRGAEQEQAQLPCDGGRERERELIHAKFSFVLELGTDAGVCESKANEVGGDDVLC